MTIIKTVLSSEGKSNECSEWSKRLVNHMSDKTCCDVLVVILKRFGWIQILEESKT